MARAYPQSQPSDYQRDGGDWQSLRQELVTLLDKVDGEVSRSRRGYGERGDGYFETPANGNPENRHRDALRSVQRQLSRFEEPVGMPPNPRDSLESAISQIRSRQGVQTIAAAQPAPIPVPRENTAVLEKLAQSVNGLSGRLEKLEGEIHTQLKSGADVKDVADQVGQLAHVVELLAGAVGETGQVKRLEGQIASLGRIISQGREIDHGTLTRRLDDIAETVGKLAELQVHYADKVENPVASQAFRDGMQAIEDNVRNVYDRIDSLERNGTLTPGDMDQVTAQMARFVEAVREHSGAPQGLVELIDALNLRIADIESGDRLLQGLRKDLGALRESVVVSLAPRFDAIEHRMDALSTRDDMAEIGRQIGALSDRLGEHSPDVSVGHLEAQVRQLVARMDQTGEQLANLARVQSEPGSVAMPDIGAMADLVAERAAAAMGRSGSLALTETLDALESRISAMLSDLPHDRDVGDVNGMQAGISEVNDRLRRLEESLMARASGAPAPAPAATPPSRAKGIEAIIAEAERSNPRPRDVMPRSPAEDAPLVAPPFPEPMGPVSEALEAKAPRKRHPGLEADIPLADRYETPQKPVPSAGYAPETAELPPPPRPSLDFSAESAAEGAREVSPASTNTFIAAARRAAQRQQQQQQATPKAASAASGSLMGRALSRFHIGGETAPAVTPEPVPMPAAEPKAKVRRKDKAAKAEKATPTPAAMASAPEPTVRGADHDAAKPSFLIRNRRAIVLGVAVLVIAALAINLVVQRLVEPADTAVPAAPATTGDILAPTDNAAMDAIASSMPPRVIPTDEIPTGSIDHGVSPAFTNSPVQAMPSTFSAQPSADTSTMPSADAQTQAPAAPATDTASEVSTEVANVDPSAITPAATSPVVAAPAGAGSVALPPDKVGPIELRQAAANGDPRADFEVAAIYSEGRAVPQDYAAAATWYQRAAEQGFAPAEYRLGSLYESGKGVTKDLKAAETWYEKAAEAGNRMSMHNLASLYAGGQMGPQQFDKAAKWFEQAANLGLVDSQFNLGMLYARGLGVPQSLQDSFKWFGIAALSGDKDSAKARDDIARSLDAATVAKLTADVNAFKPGSIDIAANFAPIGTWSQKFDPGETIAAKDIVQSVQKALSKLGYDVGTPDGLAGKKTADAIKSFEAATGMSQVGLINPRLLAVLGSQPV